MIFKQIEEIIAGQKTQTRRVYKPGEYAVDSEGYTAVAYTGHRDMAETIHSVYTPGDRLKWQVGRTYAVVPKRGQPALWWRPPEPDDIYESAYCIGKPDDADPRWQPLRIRITAIRQERLQDISEADAVAEGYPVDSTTWNATGGTLPTPREWYRDLWESINGKGSWSKPVQVWVLQFEVVR